MLQILLQMGLIYSLTFSLKISFEDYNARTVIYDSKLYTTKPTVCNLTVRFILLNSSFGGNFIQKHDYVILSGNYVIDQRLVNFNHDKASQAINLELQEPILDLIKNNFFIIKVFYEGKKQTTDIQCLIQNLETTGYKLYDLADFNDLVDLVYYFEQNYETRLNFDNLLNNICKLNVETDKLILLECFKKHLRSPTFQNYIENFD
ncbi:hypothetical protein NGRA_3020 [Nosema granulosis]|uniref:Uncharacterized protein n=1 Tax=Nosema granulosis TaxID=83296 RepID=A0A9P6GX01_9MICR|nr:hypothetical protein NGRA_3020 [Nosema granulosis]